jgi:Flp pilus assembly protein TadD
VRSDPYDAPVLNNYANLLLALNQPEARAQAERALSLDPQNAAFADTLGWILVKQGQLDAALRYLREARLRNPHDGQIRLHLAYALAKSGRTPEAREELVAALKVPGIETLEEVAPLRKELGV